jgi:superfamily II DNA or RNA helicase
MQRVVMDNIRQASVLAAVGSACYARGARYARQQAVTGMWSDDDGTTLCGTVLGSLGDPYKTTVFFSRGDGQMREFTSSQCTCPVGINCKHAVALVLTATEPSTAAALAAPARQPARPAFTARATAGRTAALPAAASLPGAGQDATSAAQRTASPAPGPASAAQRTTSPAPGASGQNAEPGPQSPASRTVAWAQSLESLLKPAPGPAEAEGTPLAVELSIDLGVRSAYRRGPAQARPQVRIAARLVQPGKKGWIGGNLSWGRLDALQFYGGYRDAQLRLLREIYAMYRLRGSYQDWYQGYGDERYIDLTEFESRRLWPLLDEAEAAGVHLIQPRAPGPVGHHRSAEFCLDATSGDAGGLVITPQIRIDGENLDVVPVAFIGSEGHGLAYADVDDAERVEPTNWPLRLARMTRPVPAPLQQMALKHAPLSVPADGLTRFLDEYYPRLRHAATVISTDSSFTPPQVSSPILLLRADYGARHDLDLSWAWAYQVGDSRLTAPLHSVPARDGYRDVDAERKALATLDLPLDRFGLLQPGAPAGLGAPPVLAPRARLGGSDTMRFTTELLPLLAGQPGVAVEISGEPADYREAGDSLRIGVSADEVSGDTDWFDLGITITVEGREVPFLDVFTALARGESHLLLDDGAYFSLGKPELQALARLIEEARALQDAPPDQLRISRFQAGLWDELTELGVVSREASAWQAQVQGLLSLGAAGAAQPAQPPAGLRAELRPYQLQGFQWLAFLWQHQLGGILADDMGLGKTLQALALIAHARQASPVTAAESTAAESTAPFLIVAPTSVVPNWAAEAARFLPGLRVAAVTETGHRSGHKLGDLIAGADAVVTSYTLLRIDFEAYSAAPWSGLILDEAQFAKNHQSKIYQCARRLRAPFKLAVTGTPMQNNLMELWSLLSITAPGLFPSPVRFCDYYARPIERQGQAELLAQLRRRIRPLVLRRTKEQVAADLPAKQEQVLRVDLHPRHRKIYQTYLQRERQKVLGLIEDMNANRFTIFRSLTLLRQLSLHAGLVDPERGDVPSAKVDTLLDQLRQVTGGGHRALVFSQFTGFLAVVRSALEDAGIEYCYLDGSTRDRASVLRRFKGGPAPVFLISLKAGGFGLNLTEADYCFLLDPWWNPATEAQAIDRTHRIGQSRNVMVYRLIASDTIEEKVMALKARKAQLFADVIDGGQDGFSSALTPDDIRALLD